MKTTFVKYTAVHRKTKTIFVKNTVVRKKGETKTTFFYSGSQKKLENKDDIC